MLRSQVSANAVIELNDIHLGSLNQNKHSLSEAQKVTRLEQKLAMQWLFTMVGR